MKKKMRLIILFATLFYTLISRAAYAQTAVSSGKDLFPVKAVIRYARDFTITYHSTYKVINILNSTAAHKDTLQYVLVERGTAPPRGYGHARLVTIPLQSIVATSSLHIALAEFCGAAELITGLGSFKYVTSAVVRKNMKVGKVSEVGNEGSMNNERLIAMHPGIVMVDAIPEAKFSRFQTLESAGIPVMLNAEWLENTPLARAEWVKLMAAFLDREALVIPRFNALADRYARLAALAAQVKTKPSAIIGMPYKGTWFTPAGGSYMAIFLKDAGIAYAWAGKAGTGSLSLNFETVAPVALKADFWLNAGYVNSRADISAIDSRYSQFAPFRSDHVFNDNKKVNDLGSNDYWESGAVNPDVVLADLIRIVHPELLPGHELVYFKQLR